MSAEKVNHYKWLEKHLPQFFENLGLNVPYAQSLIQSHGDKCYTQDYIFEKNGIPFHQGVAIYLLTHVSPYDKEVRQTDHGWVDPFQWIIENKERFLPHMPNE